MSGRCGSRSRRRVFNAFETPPTLSSHQCLMDGLLTRTSWFAPVEAWPQIRGGRRSGRSRVSRLRAGMCTGANPRAVCRQGGRKKTTRFSMGEIAIDTRRWLGVITPSRERDGFSGDACGIPLRYRPLARSGPASPCGLGGVCRGALHSGPWPIWGAIWLVNIPASNPRLRRAAYRGEVSDPSNALSVPIFSAQIKTGDADSPVA
jgi:hypothetical protein